MCSTDESRILDGLKKNFRPKRLIFEGFIYGHSSALASRLQRRTENAVAEHRNFKLRRGDIEIGLLKKIGSGIYEILDRTNRI